MGGAPEPVASAEIAQLCARAAALAGRTVGEVARAHGVALPASFARSKGFVGDLVERALGLPRGARSRAGPDLEGLEIKTLPIGPRGEPTESTFVCVLSRDGLDVPWRDSSVRRKIARVLFVPVEGSHVEGAARRIGTPLLWSPSATEDELLERDWDDLSAAAATLGESIPSAKIGEALQVRPKGRSGAERRPRRDAAGALASLAPRGFYLRRSFTAAILARSGLHRSP